MTDPKIKHDDAIEWPNGEGFTPCTREYADLAFKADVLRGDKWDTTLDDLSFEDYEEWNKLTDQLGQLQLNGHVGKSVRYAK